MTAERLIRIALAVFIVTPVVVAVSLLGRWHPGSLLVSIVVGAFAGELAAPYVVD